MRGDHLVVDRLQVVIPRSAVRHVAIRGQDEPADVVDLRLAGRVARVQARRPERDEGHRRQDGDDADGDEDLDEGEGAPHGWRIALRSFGFTVWICCIWSGVTVERSSLSDSAPMTTMTIVMMTQLSAMRLPPGLPLKA